MNGGIPPFFGMFGGPGMPQLATASTSSSQQQQQQQQQPQNRLPPHGRQQQQQPPPPPPPQATSNHSFLMNDSVQASLAQAQQQQIQMQQQMQQQRQRQLPQQQQQQQQQRGAAAPSNPPFMMANNPRSFPAPSTGMTMQQAGAPNPMFLANTVQRMAAVAAANNAPNLQRMGTNPTMQQSQTNRQGSAAAAAAAQGQPCLVAPSGAFLLSPAPGNPNTFHNAPNHKAVDVANHNHKNALACKAAFTDNNVSLFIPEAPPKGYKAKDKFTGKTRREADNSNNNACNNGNHQQTSNLDNKEQLARDIVQPHDHDVLCGRGGLTNFHRGNVWYRRLVKCNRQLYKESVKYTKLLVSKAIVQAVHSQSPQGRFIECAKDTGLWHEISYKKALDKTSQALRERDRDDDEDLFHGMNVALVRIPLPGENAPTTGRSNAGAANGSMQLAPTSGAPMPMAVGSKMAFPPPGMIFPPPGGMTAQQQQRHQSAAATATMSVAAAMNPQNSNMTPAQQANVIQQASRMMASAQQQAHAMHAAAAGFVGANQQANMLSHQHQQQQQRQQANSNNDMTMGPVLHSSQQPQQQPSAMLLQNLPPELARILQNHPMMQRGGTPASGAPRVLGPTGEPLPQETAPSPTAAMAANTGSQASGGVQIQMPHANVNTRPGALSQSWSNASGRMTGSTVVPILAVPRTTSGSAQSTSRNSQGPMPQTHSGSMLVARRPTSMSSYGPVPGLQDTAQSARSSTTNGPANLVRRATSALEGLADLASVQVREPTSAARASPATQIETTQHDQDQNESIRSPPVFRQQPLSGSKRQDDGETRKRRRVDGSLSPLPPLALERQSSSMAEFLRETKLVGSNRTNSKSLHLPNLDKMTPEETKQFALQLLQFAQRQQEEQDKMKESGPRQASSVGKEKDPPSISSADSSLYPSGGKTPNDIAPLSHRGTSTNIYDTNVSDLEPLQLKQQVSDWLEHIFPLQQEAAVRQNTIPVANEPPTERDDDALPSPPPALEQSVSEALLSLSTGPSQFLSGVSTLFDRGESIEDSSTLRLSGGPDADLQPRSSAGASSETGKRLAPERSNMTTFQQHNVMPAHGISAGGTIQEQMSALQRKPTLQEQLRSLHPRLPMQRKQLAPLAPRPNNANQSKLLELAPRPTEEPLSTLAPHATNTADDKALQEATVSRSASADSNISTIQEHVPPRKPLGSSTTNRAGLVVKDTRTIQEQMASLQPSRGKTIQEQMSDIVRTSTTRSASSTSSLAAPTPSESPMMNQDGSLSHQTSASSNTQASTRPSLLDDYEEPPAEARMRLVRRK